MDFTHVMESIVSAVLAYFFGHHRGRKAHRKDDGLR